jgi:parallel beta-helix repeat protein
MMMKWLALGIILLFMGASIIPAIAQETEKQLQGSKGEWLYVGGSDPGNYSKIQDAVDNASEGDTVFVYDDSSPYYESVVVNTSIMLVGESRDTTVIDAEAVNYSLALSIYADNVQVRGFCFQNTGWESYGLGVFTVSDIVIADNLFPGNFNGIYIADSSSILVEDNMFVDDRTAVEITPGCSHASVLWNHFDQGIMQLMMGATDSTVCENTFKGYSANGMRLSGQNVSVLKNTFDSEFDSDSNIGIFITRDTLDAWIQNNIINGGRVGIFVEAVDSSSICISYNMVTNTSYGIKTWLSSKVNVSCNNFIQNDQHAYFGESWWFQRNYWDGNYWDNYRGTRGKIILGTALFLIIPLGYYLPAFCLYLPWVNVDWHPAQVPYDIGG